MPDETRSILHINRKRKYGDEIRMAMFNMFCEGKSTSEIAKELKLHYRVVERLKNQKWPESWEEGRAKRVALKVKAVEEEAIEKFENVQARLQKTWRAVSNATAGRIIRSAQADTLPPTVALEALVAAAESEQKLYMPLSEVFAPKNQQITMGAFSKPTGEIGVMAALNQNFERIHGPDKPDPEGT